MIDHRLGQRQDIRVPVRIRLPDASQCAGLALNVGWGGIFVCTMIFSRGSWGRIRPSCRSLDP